MPRLFVALIPPLQIRQLLISGMGAIAGARWQSDAQLHLTLAFIGDIQAGAAAQIADGLMRISHSRLVLRIDGTGHFARAGMVQSVWAGLAPDQSLTALSDKVRRALRRAGHPCDDRAFVPHITLARLNRSSGPLKAFLTSNAKLSSEPFAIDTFALVESVLGHDGASYFTVAQYPLG